MDSSILNLTNKIAKNIVDISDFVFPTTRGISLALNSLLRTPHGLPTR